MSTWNEVDAILVEQVDCWECISRNRHSLRQGVVQKSELAQHAYKKGHHMSWKETVVLKIELNNACRKYKESAHMARVVYPIIQPSFDISPI
jgi:hypothetical protein